MRLHDITLFASPFPGHAPGTRISPLYGFRPSSCIFLHFPMLCRLSRWRHTFSMILETCQTLKHFSNIKRAVKTVAWVVYQHYTLKPSFLETTCHILQDHNLCNKTAYLSDLRTIRRQRQAINNNYFRQLFLLRTLFQTLAWACQATTWPGSAQKRHIWRHGHGGSACTWLLEKGWGTGLYYPFKHSEIIVNFHFCAHNGGLRVYPQLSFSLSNNSANLTE